MDPYRRSMEGASVSLECDTDNVPKDGRYHLLRDSKVISSYKSLKAATTAYQALLDELGITLKAAPQPAPQEVQQRLVGDFYVYGKSKRRKTGTRTFG
jgi:hypothetical protein